VQRRRFSTGARVADVYAWAQLALLQGICPTMDVQLQQLRQQTPSPGVAATVAAKAAGSNESSGSGSGSAAAEAVAALHISQSSVEVPVSNAAPPADVDEHWVQQWTEQGAGSGGSGWAWRGGWRLVQTYPRRPLPCDCADAGAYSGDTVGAMGLAPQAALAVEQLEDDRST
jgi:hypothetical protein